MKREESRVTRFDYDLSPGYFAMHTAWWEQGAFRERIHNVISLLKSPGPRVLDVGTGVGTFAIELAEQDCQIAALDYSAQALDFCRTNALKRKVLHSIQAVQGGAERLPFADGIFDTVVAADILEHLYAPLALLREIRRVLRPGGKAVFETPNADFLRIRGYRRLISWLQRLVPLPENVNKVPMPPEANYDCFHVHIYSVAQFRRDLALAGLQIERLDTRGWWLEPRGLDRIATGLMALPGLQRVFRDVKGTDIVAVARKVEA